MEIREVILHAFYRRVKQGDMDVKQVPIPYQKPLQELLDIAVAEKEEAEEDNIEVEDVEVDNPDVE